MTRRKHPIGEQREGRPQRPKPADVARRTAKPRQTRPDAKATCTIQGLLQKHFEAFASRNPVSPDMRRAAMYMQMCRTRHMGGHVNECPEGHYQEIAYNSCRHRSCPQCGWMPREQWLDGWKHRLLACPHFHTIFTLPHEFNVLWRYNKTALSDTLFETASETLRELLADEKYLGARVGLLCALHTWNQTLQEHIHLHVLVTAGGLLGGEGEDDEPRWIEAKKSCLLPRQVLMIKFRGKFRAKLLARQQRGDLKLPPSMSVDQFQTLLLQVGRVPWNVKILDRYDHGQGVVTYLARYLKGGAIGNSRLIKIEDGQVVFRYRLPTSDGGDGKRQGVARLPIDEFIARLLEHVPPRRYQAIRGYGLYCGNQHSRLEEARLAVEGKPVDEEPAEPRSWQERCEAAGYSEASCCPKCGARLISHHEFESGRGPPIPTRQQQAKKVAA